MDHGPPYLVFGIWIALAFALFAGMAEVSLRQHYGIRYVLEERWMHRVGLTLVVTAAATLLATAVLQVYG